MEFIAQRGEIIIMEDEECYLVLKNIEYNGEAYQKTVKTGDYLLDDQFEVDKESEVYLKEIIENEECFYDFVTDEEIIKVLKTL